MKNEQTKRILNQAVADLSQFSIVIHQTHWYMRGEGFLVYHPKMDEYMDDINERVDVVAERLITIGGSPYSTLEEFKTNTKIKDEPGTFDKSMVERIENLLEGYRYLADLFRQGIDITEEEDDIVSQDIFTSMKADFEKTIWMLSAELGKEPGL
ncbi:Dps family protein [Vagococcus jeotgali]|uniref:Dps family protein n=1 Tax=Vagococcus jeotgali TaxID=3109030 RepID=UPI002DDA6F60|nr:Dps family protein [Vagococcus sp. B2T-5]